jgi:hypothetical protein
MKPGISSSRCELLIGLAGGVLAVCLVYVLFNPSWQKLPLPEKAAQVIRFDDHHNGTPNDVYIKMESSEVYVCRWSLPFWTFKWTCEKPNKDFEANREPEYPSSCGCGAFPTPQPPGKVALDYEYHPCIVDSCNQVNLVILEDGSIWQWSRSESDIGFVFMGCTAIVVGSVGMLVSTLYVRLWIKMREKSRMDELTEFP